MNKPFIRETVRRVQAEAAGRRLHTWNDLLSTFPNLIGVKTATRTAPAGRRSPQPVAAASRSTPRCSGARPAKGGMQISPGCSPGSHALPDCVGDRWGRTYGTVRTAYGKPAVGVVAAKPALRVIHVERPLVERVVIPVEAALPVRKGQRLGEVQVLDRGTVIARSPLVAAEAVDRPGTLGRVGAMQDGRSTTRGALRMIVTVTLNAALDRTLTVPHFQMGQRHRASQVLTLAGGKGINVARALKRLEVPVVATGLTGGRTGTRIVEELTAEAILNDFVRIGEESRTSTAVVDPTESSYTEINEWGPKVTTEELEFLLEKLHYLSRAPTTSSSPGRCHAASRRASMRRRCAT